MKTLNEWLDLADEKPYQAFQLDGYVLDYTPFPRGWTNSLETGVNQIILSLDGKIWMEFYNELFEFFTNLIKERLSKYQLSEEVIVKSLGLTEQEAATLA